MVGRHCVASNQASCVSVVTVAVIWASGTIFDASAGPQTWTDAKWQSILAYLRNGGR